MAFPTQKDIELPLLEEIEALGGKAEPKALYDPLAKRFTPPLTESDLKEKEKNGRNKWEHRVNLTRAELFRKGEIDSPAFGVWRITEKGRERLRREGEVVKHRPDELDKLAQQIKRLVGELVDMAVELAKGKG